MYKKYIQAWAY